MNVFLSYSSKDEASARAIGQFLAERGLRVWWDRSLLPGQDYEKEIARELHTADVVIMLWSQHAQESHWVVNEAREVREKKPVIPCLLDDSALPMDFRSLHHANLRAEGAMEELYRAVQRAGGVAGPVPSGGNVAVMTPTKDHSSSEKPKHSPPSRGVFPVVATGLAALGLATLGVIWGLYWLANLPLTKPAFTGSDNGPPTEGLRATPENEPALPPLRLVSSAGPLILKGSYSVDLDTETVGGEDPGRDIFWSLHDDEIRWLKAMNGAQFLNLGQETWDLAPDLIRRAEGASDSTLNGIPDANNQIPSGTMILVRTNQGRLCKLRIEEYGIAAPGDLPEWPKSSLRIRWQCFE